MKYLSIAILLAAFIPGLCPATDASWLIDAERYHVSAHGQLSCHDCHDDVGGSRLHPDPADVNRDLKDFFGSGQCAACHEDTMDEIAGGRHAGQDATPWQGFDNCIACHDPHYETGSGDSAATPQTDQPVNAKCSRCHEYQPDLPDFPDEDQSCVRCHLVATGNGLASAEKIFAFCFHCHSSEDKQRGRWTFAYPLIDAEDYASTPHGEIACLVCHPGAAEFGHDDQPVGDCRQCHLPHAEKVAHDAHMNVNCGACHLQSVIPTRAAGDHSIGYRTSRYENRISPVHQMRKLENETACRGCHSKGNTLGAAAMVLPAKGIICMPCHTATFSAGDTVTVLSLLLFGIGFLAVGSVWVSAGDRSAGTGSRLKKTAAAVFGSVFSGRLFVIVKNLLLDGLLQRRLFRASRERWLLHALIFYPFLFRFIWGGTALLTSLWQPEWPGTWLMLDKNHPATAFLFDLSGMMVIIGIVGMIICRLQRRLDPKISGLPAADWPAYAILGSIIVGGFILEGMRISMTGSPGGAPYAFVGDAISRMLAGFELTGVYGYIWYLHAGLTGVFVVYLPFSRMFHMIIAPVSLTVIAASRRHS